MIEIKTNEADWLLRGKEEIRAYLKGASDHILKKWIAAGMPILIGEGEWVAHKKNLEEFFQSYTRKRVSPADL